MSPVTVLTTPLRPVEDEEVDDDPDELEPVTPGIEGSVVDVGMLGSVGAFGSFGAVAQSFPPVELPLAETLPPPPEADTETLPRLGSPEGAETEWQLLEDVEPDDEVLGELGAAGSVAVGALGAFAVVLWTTVRDAGCSAARAIWRASTRCIWSSRARRAV